MEISMMNTTDKSASKSKAGPVRRNKRIRVNFTHKQVEAMETVFRQTQYPDVTIVEILADKLQLPVEKICTWFQNRRSKFRKESKKGHIQWMRQQLYSDSDKCSGVPVASPPTSASHVLTPPTDGEVKMSTTSPQMHHMPHSNYQQPNHVPMAPFCLSNYTSTPSPPNPVATSSYSPQDYASPQLPGNTCMTSWSNQQSLSSALQYPGYDMNAMNSCTAAYRDTPYMGTYMPQYSHYPDTQSYGFSFPNIDMSEYYFSKLGSDWSPSWYEPPQTNSPAYATEVPQVSPV